MTEKQGKTIFDQIRKSLISREQTLRLEFVDKKKTEWEYKINQEWIRGNDR